MILVELCAGSAALSLSLRGATPPLAYQGSKRAYAARIAAALGLRPDADLVWVEPGPWAEAWQLWRTTEGRRDTCDRLRTWAAETPRALWHRLRDAPVPADPAERVAAWAVLQWWSYRGKACHADAGRWRTAALDRQSAEGWPNKHRKGDARAYPSRPQVLGQLSAALLSLPDLSHVTVLQARAEDVEPIPGSVVYLDPDYQGTTSCYGHTFPRPAVLRVAGRWRAAGCVVAISEAEPLPLPGWRHLDLGASGGRNWSRQQAEYLTLSPEVRP